MFVFRRTFNTLAIKQMYQGSCFSFDQRKAQGIVVKKPDKWKDLKNSRLAQRATDLCAPTFCIYNAFIIQLQTVAINTCTGLNVLLSEGERKINSSSSGSQGTAASELSYL